jgi:hypothetical protein
MKKVGSCFAALIFALIVTTASSAHAESVTVQVGAGGGGFESIDSAALTVAATFYLPIGEDAPVRLGIRPQFDWHHLQFGEDYFFTGSLQMDFPINDRIVPTVFLGAGVNHVTFSSGSATGAVFNVGCEGRLFPTKNFFVAPGFTYARGFGDVEGNNYQVTASLGVAF